MALEGECSTVATYMFRGIEYVVTMNTSDGSSLVVEVEDKVTADQWRGTFEALYIEDLTHKTGNFKQFSIFTSMLESALTQSSDSVSLDLLTYSDLESLRNRKAGAGSTNIPPARNATQHTKRYLILTYTVEFDRIHYPLPLPYMGKPDPRKLQEIIRQLRQENKTLKRQGSKEHAHKELDKMRKEFERLLQEKKDTLGEFLDYKREVETTSQGVAAKQLRILKGIVSNLEEELTTERSKRQRSSNKRSQEMRDLLNELEEVKASERNLRVRVKSLTNELAIYKRRGHPGKSSTATSSDSGRRANSYSRVRSSSRENSFTRDTSRTSNGRGQNSSRGSYQRSSNKRDSSFGRDASYHSQQSRGRSLTNGDASFGSRRSASRESLDRGRSANRSGSSRRERSLSWDRSRERSWTSRQSRSPSPSAAGSRTPRFDPTAYVKEKDRMKREAEMKQKRHIKGHMSGSGGRRRYPSPAGSDHSYGRRRHHRTSSVGSLNSRTSSLESLSDIPAASDSDSRQRRRGGRAPASSHSSALSNSWNSSANGSSRYPPRRGITKKILASTPERGGHTRKTSRRNHDPPSDVGDMGDNDYFDRSAEISEIDARLNRLQQFMKTNLA